MCESVAFHYQSIMFYFGIILYNRGMVSKNDIMIPQERYIGRQIDLQSRSCCREYSYTRMVELFTYVIIF